MYTLSKSERLCSDTLIKKLFAEGNRSLTRFPFRFTWLETEHPGVHPVQVLFVVSKRQFKTSTARNKIKRQLRELYRHIKPDLYHHLGKRKLILSIGYIGKTPLPFQEMKTIFNQMALEFYGHIQTHH